ncbi:hypothetical protein HU200_065713 [Digitaria exilis]|uniref:F-box domain-containing protein n=1 Tax=Digitaria exilis TaxID=1010633 RepID=A0A834ZZJ6_9POAL|nr:hypothetical protein HU200_065713 [Digitaria exilis]
MGDRWDRIAADIFMDILRRLPPTPRRRLRLVCPHWRSVIDDRTPATQARAMVLAFVNDGRGGRRAHVLDDLTKHGTGRARELKLPRGAGEQGVSMAGASNGLRRLRGDFVVVNPATGERLAVPPPWESPRSSTQLESEYSFMYHATQASEYSFMYHSGTGLYKIVHVPCDGAVKVFTLGDTSWRDVPVPGWASRVPSLGLASVAGATYWIAVDSFELD